MRTGLEGAEEVAQAAARMDESLARAGVERATFLVQAMVEDGVELLVGVATDPVFGPSSPAAPAAPRSSCSATSRSASARSAAATPPR